ncbi:uncharacterized protein LOC129588206 [Paramacrobiotus metropolitanus]|uniref:uncharacterized protein LOC129588206 n=1 Tax=Paramacrobiotus metropolitanus TaxID=2943436 RepID=UPI00244565F3|nr:uncharacterized protein LOC129588206 [Paramacrobiotus metropolitanus]XP_055338333.1 uncharacterized protein LOC129588206 [Paramacrobiotus metropolitanus]
MEEGDSSVELGDEELDEEYHALQEQIDELFQGWNASAESRSSSLYDGLHEASQNYNNCLLVAEKMNARSEKYMLHILSNISQLKDAVDTDESTGASLTADNVQAYQKAIDDFDTKLSRYGRDVQEKINIIRQRLTNMENELAEKRERRKVLLLELARKEAYLKAAVDFMGFSVKITTGNSCAEVTFAKLGDGAVSEGGTEMDLQKGTVRRVWPASLKENLPVGQELNGSKQKYPLVKLLTATRRALKEHFESLNSNGENLG